MKTSDPPIIVHQEFDVSVDRFWEAITQHDHLTQWFFDNIPDFKAEVGFTTEFFVQNEDRKFTHLWKIIEVKPLEKIIYYWRYEEYPGDSNITFFIEPLSSGSRLTVSAEIIENFADSVPEFEYDSGVHGWTYFINGRLKEYLD